MNILFASSEIHPLIKTGGLADVCGYLPRALRGHGATVHVIMPAYSEVLAKLDTYNTVAEYRSNGHSISILETRLPNSQVKLWLTKCPELFERDGGPYQDNDSIDWPDNARRFGIFTRAVVAVTMGWTKLRWPIDIVHCHDWQTGLIPALLKLHSNAPSTVFTVHNLAYQGLFSEDIFKQLALPPHLWSSHALEFYNQLSFIKGGIVFADKVNTVSPRYAEEIKTEAFGCGLEKLLQSRADDLSGILNGIDIREWNPGTDTLLAENYNKRSLNKKITNKLALQKLMKLPQDESIPVLSVVSRLTHQKGVDLIIKVIEMLADTAVQLCILGTGEKTLESQLRELAKKFPKKLGIKIAYNETWAHMCIAGGNAFLMPSRFEPCGLTQLYSLRYGTLPIARNVGGLADTIVDATPANIKNQTATGFLFDEDSAESLFDSISHALTLYANKTLWKKLQLTAMKQDFSWNSAAESYMQLYQEIRRDLLGDRHL